MNASQKTEVAYFNHIGSIEIPSHLVGMGHHQGQCDMDIAEMMQMPEIIAELSEIDPEALKKELREYGCWEEEDLKDHQHNLERILWLACGSIQDEG